MIKIPKNKIPVLRFVTAHTWKESDGSWRCDLYEHNLRIGSFTAETQSKAYDLAYVHLMENGGIVKGVAWQTAPLKEGS